jgi:hypothetical protein
LLRDPARGDRTGLVGALGWLRNQHLVWCGGVGHAIQ